MSRSSYLPRADGASRDAVRCVRAVALRARCRASGIGTASALSRAVGATQGTAAQWWAGSAPGPAWADALALMFAEREVSDGR